MYDSAGYSHVCIISTVLKEAVFTIPDVHPCQPISLVNKLFRFDVGNAYLPGIQKAMSNLYRFWSCKNLAYLCSLGGNFPVGFLQPYED